MLGACYAVATLVAWQSDDVQEIVTESVCAAVLVAYCAARPDGRRLVWIVVVPIPLFVLFHERFHVRHWVAYGPALVSLGMAWWYGRVRDRR